jgi:hypothetical protein
VFGQCLTRFTEALGNNFEDRTIESRRDILFKGGNADALPAPDSTAVGKKLTAEKLQHGRLSHAVATDKAYAFAFFDLKRYILKQGGTTESPAHIPHTDYGHKTVLSFSIKLAAFQAGCAACMKLRDGSILGHFVGFR